ncbi:carbonate dehydratase [Lacihabitans soyangensis]|uniref:Carbonic anhydrase n=1 Tax=Lacihabitans soyangensis TaxID=869394 RepID=A0AAE3KVY7_9BACT|nr:carbonate dehydratase [Lacihabitans soyangensis]MCP9761995.1 carbonate dehydratase [Lacihabitans soyangensis]
MKPIDKLIENNRKWAADVVKDDPEFFSRLSNTQKPDFLWIGCSDSRVPADRITGTQPGEIFVHRNIANMVIHTDMNLLAVLEYAVDHLNVSHIIVCGHYGCGGVRAAMTRHNYDLINKWIRNIKDVYRMHRERIDYQTKPEERLNKLIELNVEEQVMNLAKTSIVQRAWKAKKSPEIHGWVYSLEDGLIKELCTMTHKDHLDPLYEFDDL